MREMSSLGWLYKLAHRYCQISSNHICKKKKNKRLWHEVTHCITLILHLQGQWSQRAWRDELLQLNQHFLATRFVQERRRSGHVKKTSNQDHFIQEKALQIVFPVDSACFHRAWVVSDYLEWPACVQIWIQLTMFGQAGPRVEEQHPPLKNDQHMFKLQHAEWHAFPQRYFSL